MLQFHSRVLLTHKIAAIGATGVPGVIVVGAIAAQKRPAVTVERGPVGRMRATPAAAIDDGPEWDKLDAIHAVG
jgi:hypothetical protein